MRTLFYTFVISLVVFLAFGCAQNTTPVAQQQSAVVQELPQRTENDVRNLFFFNGDVPIEFAALVTGRPITTQPATLIVDDEEGATMEASAPGASHTMVMNFGFRSWGDSSQGGQADGSQVQETTADQTVRAALELMLQYQQALLAQMSGTSGQAVESSTADTTGGAQSLESKVDILIELLLEFMSDAEGE